MKKKMFKLSASLMLVLTLLLTLSASVFASSPTIRKTTYEGKGIVEVDFTRRVRYKDVKVTVKDNDGKAYKTVIVEKDKDDLEFKILKYQKGKTYKFTITGIKVRGSQTYGKVTGTVKIPAPVTNPISGSKAISIAVNHAAKHFNLSNIIEKEVEKDLYKGTPSWEVEFKARMNGRWYEFDYDIDRASGKILHFEYEPDLDMAG
ncbi:MAG: PepSY domain-containing protein [Lachnospiraceae bacterium]